MSGSENYKSHIKNSPPALSFYGQGVFFSKLQERINKLVTALYMVTDIMDNSEPLRIKLRSLGGDVLSDTYGDSRQINKKIVEILSFLDIGATVGMISEMNASILRKEFSDVHKSISDLSQFSSFWGRGETALLDFLKEGAALPDSDGFQRDNLRPTRVGVQKGSTLMKALSDKISDMSVSNSATHDVLKRQRRSEIIDILKGQSSANPSNFGGMTITEIRGKSSGVLASCSEKTLQRELVTMVGDGMLKKTGAKRWSRYFLTPT